MYPVRVENIKFIVTSFIEHVCSKVSTRLYGKTKRFRNERVQNGETTSERFEESG